MKLILIEETNIDTLDRKYIELSIKYNGCVKIKDDSETFYKILRIQDDNRIILLKDNIEVIVELDKVLEIRHNLNKTIYKTDFSYLGGNSQYYDIDNLNKLSVLICKNNISPFGDIFELTIGKSYYRPNHLFKVCNTDNRVIVGVFNDHDMVVTLDYEWYFKTQNDIRNEQIDLIYKE